MHAPLAGHAPASPFPLHAIATGPRRLRLVLTVCRALWRLAWCHRLQRRGFGRLHAFVRARVVAPHAQTELARRQATREVVDAVEEACVWYVARVQCLQRAAVTTWMLRDRGVNAALVIGVRPMPLEMHAWVEVDGVVVNDRPQYPRFFTVIERL